MEKSSQNPSFGQGLELAGIIIKAIASAAKKRNADLDRVQAVIGKPGLIFQLVEDLFADLFAEEKAKKNPSILKCISGGEKIIIEASDGKACISNAKIFTGIHRFNCNEFGPATAETLLDVSEMTSDGTFLQIFTSIASDIDKLVMTQAPQIIRFLEKLVMTQAQIISFCEKYPTWLCQEGGATLFLTKVNGKYFVAYLTVLLDGLNINRYPLVGNCIFSGERRYRVVSPQVEQGFC